VTCRGRRPQRRAEHVTTNDRTREPPTEVGRSGFALHAGWTPGRLAAGTRYTSYYTVGASTVHDLGYEVWATDTFTEGEPDPTNPVHFDIVIQRNIPLDVLADRTGTPAQRRDLRNRFLPELERLLGRLDGPRPLDDDESYDLDPWRLP
jgi:hypothetical protein